MSERRLEPAREHQLAEALQAHPEASAGSFQAARIPDRAAGALGQGVPLGVCPVCGRHPERRWDFRVEGTSWEAYLRFSAQAELAGYTLTVM